MNDDNLTSLFADYAPELPSDDAFMRQLRRNLRAIEQLQGQMCLARRRQRLALLVAAIVGFCFGVLAAIFYPVILNTLTTVSGKLSVPSGFMIDYYGNILVLGMLCVVGTGLVFSAYDLTETLAVNKPQPSANR